MTSFATDWQLSLPLIAPGLCQACVKLLLYHVITALVLLQAEASAIVAGRQAERRASRERSASHDGDARSNRSMGGILSSDTFTPSRPAAPRVSIVQHLVDWLWLTASNNLLHLSSNCVSLLHSIKHLDLLFAYGYVCAHDNRHVT